MKKYLYSTLAFAALLMVSCSVKEEPVVIDESSNEPAKGDLITIVGNAPENPLSKTAYDFSSGSKGEFSWVASDQIALIVKHGSGDPKVYDVNNLNRYTLYTSDGQITDGGKTAEFTNLMSYHTLEGGDWASTGFAVYPPSLSQVNSNSGYDDVFVKLPSTVSGGANNIYLVGTPNDPSNPTNYTFKTAMGVFQVTLNHIPDQAKYIRLVTSDKTNYPLDGDFKLAVGADGAVTIGAAQFLPGWVDYFAGYVQVDVSALADDATATYYFNIPVNSYPANTLSLQVVAVDGTVIETKTIKTSVTVERGTVYPLPTLNLSQMPLNSGLIPLNSTMITVNSDAGTLDGSSNYDGNGKAGLVDGNTSTYWHSAYYGGYSGYYDNTVDFDTTYGICIDIHLPTAVEDFHISYYTRHNNNNGRPRKIIYAGSNDGSTWTEIGSVEDACMDVGAGVRVDLPNVDGDTAYNYLRIGITKSGDASNDLTVSAGGSTALGELLLFKDK